MNNITASKTAFAISLVNLIFSLYTYATYYEFKGFFLIMTIVLSSAAVGSVIGFGGLGFSKTAKKAFRSVLFLNLVIYFIMNVAAATVVAIGSYTSYVSILGMLQLPCVLAAIVISFLSFYMPQKLPKKAAFITALCISVLFLVLCIYEIINGIGSDARSVIYNILQHIQVAVIAWYPYFSGEYKEA